MNGPMQDEISSMNFGLLKFRIRFVSLCKLHTSSTTFKLLLTVMTTL